MTFAYAKLLCTLNDKQMWDQAFMKSTTKHIANRTLWNASILRMKPTHKIFTLIHCYNFLRDIFTIRWFSRSLGEWESTQNMNLRLNSFEFGLVDFQLLLFLFLLLRYLNLIQVKIFHIWNTEPSLNRDIVAWTNGFLYLHTQTHMTTHSSLRFYANKICAN